MFSYGVGSVISVLLTLVSDQEGAVISDMFSKCCEAYNINRDLAGSESHTKTGIAERRISLIKLTALKLWHHAQRRGLALEQDICVSESTLVSNSMLVYNSSSPNQALIGQEPKDLWNIDDRSFSSYIDENTKCPDFLETTIRARLLAKQI